MIRQLAPRARVVRVVLDVVLPVGDQRDPWEVEDLVLRTVGTLSAEPRAYDVLSLRPVEAFDVEASFEVDS